MAASRTREKSVLTRQDIASKRKALQQQKMNTTLTGQRAILGVGVLTASVLALLSVATFSGRDRLGWGGDVSQLLVGFFLGGSPEPGPHE